MAAYHQERDHFLELLNFSLDGLTVGCIGLHATLGKGFASLVHGAHIAGHFLLHRLTIQFVQGIMQPHFVMLLHPCVYKMSSKTRDQIADSSCRMLLTAGLVEVVDSFRKGNYSMQGNAKCIGVDFRHANGALSTQIVCLQ